jgi:hypothetical protein
MAERYTPVDSEDSLEVLETYIPLLRMAVMKISVEWDKNHDLVDEILNENYPFSESFDDLYPKIYKWCDSSFNNVINKISERDE